MYSPERDSRGAFPQMLPANMAMGSRIIVFTPTNRSAVCSV